MFLELEAAQVEFFVVGGWKGGGGRGGGRLGDVEFSVIGRAALIFNERASGRHKDLGDIEALGGE